MVARAVPKANSNDRGLARTLATKAGELAAATTLAVVITALLLWCIARTDLAHNSLLGQAATSLIVIISAASLLLSTVWSRIPALPTWLTVVTGTTLLGSVQLAMLLRDQPHYLFGISGDQQFRIPYMHRFEFSPQLQDMFYLDAPPFYPPLWFWVGGRFAWAANIEVWEFYKFFSIATMATAGPIMFVLLRSLLGIKLACLMAALGTTIGVHTNAYEPYSWIVMCVIPAVIAYTIVALARASSRGLPDAAFWVSAVVVGLYLGLAALTYSLLAAVAAMCVVLAVFGVYLLGERSSATIWLYAQWLSVSALLSMSIAALFWQKYLLYILRSGPAETVAHHYLPRLSASLPIPLFDLKTTAAISVLGMSWIVYRNYRLFLSPKAYRQALGDVLHNLIPLTLLIGLTVTFTWYVASLSLSFYSSSLLAFRLFPFILLLCALGACGAAADIYSHRIVARLDPRALGWIAIVFVGAAILSLAQSPSRENTAFAQKAHETSPRPPQVLYVVDQLLKDRKDKKPVVLSTVDTVGGFRPYYYFQAPVQAFASPAAQYASRNEEIKLFSSASSSRELANILDNSAFEAPWIFILKQHPQGFSYEISVNNLPARPGDYYRDVVFSPAAFADDELFIQQHVGDYVVIIRK